MEIKNYFKFVSEKIRRINKESVTSRVNFSKRTAILFLIAGGVLVLAPSFYFSLKYFRAYGNTPTASVSGSIQEKISDKNLAATICKGEGCFWLNRDGIAFGKSGKTGGNLVLSFEDKTSRNLDVGQVLLKPESLAKLLFLRKRISEDLGIFLRGGETIDLNLNDFDFKTLDGWTIKLTLSENAYRTIETLKKTLEEIKKTAPSGVEGLDYIDLRIPNKVFYKFR